VIDIEKPSFNPLVFTTSGGMTLECTKLNKRLSEKIAERSREPYASVLTYIEQSSDLHCTSEEHHCCNIVRLMRQTEQCSLPESHRH